MTAWLNLVFLPLLARICLVCLFPFSGLDKILHWDEALKQANSSFLPNGKALLIIGMAVEFCAPACIILNWHDRLAAFILAGFCAVTALLYHNFWAYGDFWAAQKSQGRAHFWDFLKNFGLVGGLCLIIIGGTLSPLSSVLAHPLSSAPAMAAP
jgi:putative oxidoreductase